MNDRAERTVAVASEVGLHARPASVFTQAAQRSGIPVTIGRPGQIPVNASSILQVMALAVKYGEQVTIAAEGPTAVAVLAELAEVLATDLDAV